MRQLAFAMLGLCLTLPVPTALSAQSHVPYDRRVQWSAPPVKLDSSTVMLRVVDHESGEPLQSLLCVERGPEVRTDSTGEARVSRLPPGNTPAVVRAPHHQPTSLIFLPGWRGRSFATVRLVRDEAAPATPSCRDPAEPR